MANYYNLKIKYSNGNTETITAGKIIGEFSYQDRSIAAVEVPSCVQSIGTYAFCDNELTAVTLNEGLVSIGAQAFQHGTYGEITIPSTVTGIGVNAFNVSIEQDYEPFNVTIICKAINPPMLEDGEGITFGKPELIDAIYIPEGTLSDYESDWSQFTGKFVEGVPGGYYALPEIGSIYVGETPAVMLCLGDELVWFNSNPPTPPVPPPHSASSTDYLTFQILSPGYISWNGYGDAQGDMIEYSISYDGGENWGGWNEVSSQALGTHSEDLYVSAEALEAYPDFLIRFRGPSDGSFGSHNNIDPLSFNSFGDTTAKFHPYGNIMSLVYRDPAVFSTATTLSSDLLFAYLFGYQNPETYSIIGGNVSDASNLILPATSLSMYCYGAMFLYCTGLTSAPELPAGTLTAGCYASMFQGCMNLSYIKCLATDISAEGCTEDWVNGVSSTGTFVQDANMGDWGIGENGIPFGWEVEYDS